MVLHTPGHMIHFRQHGSTLPPWPAVVCTEDLAPNEFLETRPQSYVSLILLVGENLEFRWALTSEMNGYNPYLIYEDENLVEITPGLGEAYAIAESAREANLGLDHWRKEVQKTTIVISSDEEDTDTNDDCSDMDDDMRKAIRVSRSEFLASKRSTLSVACGDSYSDFEKDLQLAIAASKEEPQDTMPFPTPSVSPRPFKRPREHRETFEKSHSFQEQRPPRLPGLRSSLTPKRLPTLQQVVHTRDSDVLEEEICESKEYVEFLVGPDQEPRNILKVYIDTCPTFQRNFHGVSYLTLKGDSSWAVVHPNLRKIDPRDFEFVAQFLETGDFGMRLPQSEEENKNAIAECGAAWDAADKLGMGNLLDHVSNKAQRLAPWDLNEVLWLATAVYRTAEASSEAQEEFRAWLSNYMADHFWEYINDDSLSVLFQERVRQLATLGRDIHAKMSIMLGQQSDPA